MVPSTPQPTVNSLVKNWIAEIGVPVGETVGVCRTAFIKWAKLEDAAVSYVRFGRALTALGIKRRTLSGRKVIVGPKPR